MVTFSMTFTDLNPVFKVTSFLKPNNVPTKMSKSVTICPFGRRAFAVAGPTMFSALPDDLRDPAVSITTFGQSMKTHLFSAYQHV